MLYFLLEIIYPRIPGALPPQDFIQTAPSEVHLSLYVKYFVNFSIWAGGILALLFLIYGGIRYLSSTGKPETLVSAKNQIIGAFFGLLILLSSFLILKTINPEFTILEVPSLKPVDIKLPPYIEPPKTTAIQSSIDTEIPFSRIIEKLFETYVSDYPEPQDPEPPRITRIKDNVETSKEIDQKLVEQSQALKEASDKCACENTRPDPPCNHYGCNDCPPKECSCDPCENKKNPGLRKEIQDLETKNEEEINNLIEQQIKTEEEVRLLKEWLERLKRAEKFIADCPLRDLRSLAQFYSKGKSFNSQDWTLRQIKFWDDITIVYYLSNVYGQASKIRDYDFASFYCAVSGTLEEPDPFPVLAPSEQALSKAKTLEEAEKVVSESMACSDEAPVGEIIDRAKRTAQLLIDKMEELVGKEKELVDAVDKLQVLISQCTSKNCTPRCICVSCGHDCTYCVEIGCFGQACPKAKISEQLEEIEKIWQEIKDLVEGKDSNDTPETIGIMSLIGEVVPEILKDLENEVRIPMHKCSSDDWQKRDTVLFNCDQVLGATVPPQNQVARLCCQTEAWDPDKQKMVPTIYGDCFEECYLEIGINKHRACVQTCLNNKAQQINDPDLARCFNRLNFYCCNVGP